jgi:Ubiquitin family
MNSVEENQRFKLKVRPNSQGQFEVLVTSDMLISELKTIIYTYCKIPPRQQRLICHGKLLKDDLKLSSYKLSEGHVIQLSSQPQGLPESQQNDSVRRERYRGIEINERYETISQSIQTVNLMYGILTTRTDEEIIGFDNASRKFFPGQWVDVLDTVDQWLEAQILEVATTFQGNFVFIHYNGWPSQWDEWVESSSARIQPFHSYTNQSITSPMHSPHPTIPIDDENLRAPGPYDPKVFFEQGASILNKMRGMLENYYNLSMMHKHEKIGDKISDLRCRLGIPQSDDVKEWTSDNESYNGVTLDNEDKESVISVDLRSNDKTMTTEVELSLLTVQTAPLLDRTGRLLSDLATLIPNPRLPLMPSPADLSQLTSPSRLDGGIHVYAFLTPRRNT